jgi:hypothetical protein
MVFSRTVLGRTIVSYFLLGFEDRPTDGLPNYPADQPLF